MKMGGLGSFTILGPRDKKTTPFHHSRNDSFRWREMRAWDTGYDDDRHDDLMKNCSSCL